MTFPIDPIRRVQRPRRIERTPGASAPPVGGVEDRAHDAGFDLSSEAHAPKGADGAAGFSAQILGQDHHRPAQSAAPAILDAAKTAYATTQWSGPYDRRARKGSMTKTDL